MTNVSEIKLAHKCRMFAFCVILLITGACRIAAQNIIGIPGIINYSRYQYNAGNQNWDICQDKRGIMYFGNNEGLLTFDGTYWDLFKLPNSTIVRSVAISPDEKEGRIYVGGQGEMGYFSPDQYGRLKYTSLESLLKKEDNSFTDVWNICFWNGDVFFRTNRRIFQYTHNTIIVHKSDNWSFMGISAKKLVAWEVEKGLVVLKHGQWIPFLKPDALPSGVLVRKTIDIGMDSALLVTLTHGLYVLHQGKLTHFRTPDIDNISKLNIYNAIKLSTGELALVTSLSGCYIISKAGKIVQRFSRAEGIQSRNALSVMQDKNENIWLGLTNGIDLITFNNAIKHIFPEKNDANTGYTSIIYNNKLYLGLSTGVYKVDLKGENDISTTTGEFELVNNTHGQAWHLSSIFGNLMLGHTSGGYIINKDRAVSLNTSTGIWSFFQFTYSNLSYLIAGTYDGISVWNYKNGTSIRHDTDIQIESARFVIIHNNEIWVAHPYKGLYRVYFSKNKLLMEQYRDDHHFLSSNHNKIFDLAGKLVLTSDKGIFLFNDAKNEFQHYGVLEQLFKNKTLSYLMLDQYGNLWFIHDKKLGVVNTSQPLPRLLYIPEMDNKITKGGFEDINVIDSNNVLIASEKGFFHLNFAAYKKNKLKLRALVREVRISNSQRDSIIYGGYGDHFEKSQISYNQNAIYFNCSAVLYGQADNTEYSFFLKGFDKSWSEWTKKTEKGYTNLPAGTYTFNIKCRNNIDNESAITSYSFIILPPWYETWWAYLLYGACIFCVLYLIYMLQRQKYQKQQKARLEEQQRIHNEEQSRLHLQHQIAVNESENKIIQLSNEQLTAEVEHKNRELASSAMNLVRKIEMLSKLKENLVYYKNGVQADKTGKEFNKIIKMVDSELDSEQEWELFSVHFDSVHTNYLKRLKENYPNLTAADQKLAAYLKLNLSSKEIAQLMNISIRGVETARYRLRKKLNLDGNDNLSAYLGSF